MKKEKIRNLDEIIKEIENCEYIDCHKDEIFDDYQYENILYYLKQLKKQKEIIDKAIEYIRENANLKKDIEFCLHSIKQEMEMSTDERTRTEMKTCCEILRRCINE